MTTTLKPRLLVEPDGDNCGVTRESWGGFTLHWSDGRHPVELNGDEAIWLARAILRDHEANLAHQLQASVGNLTVGDMRGNPRVEAVWEAYRTLGDAAGKAEVA